MEPYPDETLGLEDGLAAPEARYEQRESVELAFIAALQLLPPNQRAVLILREVLGFSAQEVAESLDTSVASVNSALQRARKTVDDRLPEQSQQATLRALGDDELSEIVERYVEAWEQNDFETVVEMLAEDATFAMPPLASWFGGREEIAMFLEGWPLSGSWRWRPIRATANGQPALAFYAWDEDEQRLPAVRAQRADLPRQPDLATWSPSWRETSTFRPPTPTHAGWTRNIDPAAAERELRAIRPTRTTGGVPMIPTTNTRRQFMLADSKAFSGFAAPDIEAARDFYRDKLGLDVTEQEEGRLGAAHSESRG